MNQTLSARIQLAIMAILLVACAQRHSGDTETARSSPMTSPSEDSQLLAPRIPSIQEPIIDPPQTLTGVLGQAQQDPKSVVSPPSPALGDGKPLIYPPETLQSARDDRRVDPDISILVTSKKSEYRVMEPIFLKIEIKNKSDEHKTWVASGDLYWNYQINAYYDQGYLEALVPKTRYLNKHGPIGGGFGTGGLRPRADLTPQDLIANLVNDLTYPGKYSIFVEVRSGVVEIDGKMTSRVGRSNELKVKIVDFPYVIGATRLELDYSPLNGSPAAKPR